MFFITINARQHALKELFRLLTLVQDLFAQIVARCVSHVLTTTHANSAKQLLIYSMENVIQHVLRVTSQDCRIKAVDHVLSQIVRPVLQLSAPNVLQPTLLL